MEIFKHSSESNRQRSYADYFGTINKKKFRVQIDNCTSPHWYNSELDDDEKNEILEKIEAGGNNFTF